MTRNNHAAIAEARVDDAASIEGGAIIGVVDLVDVHEDSGQWNELCSEWAQTEVWHLVLVNPRPLAEPIPYRGMLGLRRLDDEMLARIEAAIA